MFAGLSNAGILRAELRRLFRWLKEKGLTAIITGERGEGSGLTRHGLEEYVSDCVIVLDHRVVDQIATRRIRVVKYRGSSHGTNEYPFLIGNTGIEVIPITSIGLDHVVTDERVSTGIPKLDGMLGGLGFYRGSTSLVSGNAGTGKTSFAAHFVDGLARNGERSLYFAFEEATGQIVRNMRSIGIDLGPWIRNGLVEMHPARPTLQGLEGHLALMFKIVGDSNPSAVVMDPITNLISIGSMSEVRSLLTRLVDFLKSRQITALFTSLTVSGSDGNDRSTAGISSLIDTWIHLENVLSNGEWNRIRERPFWRRPNRSSD